MNKSQVSYSELVQLEPSLLQVLKRPFWRLGFSGVFESHFQAAEAHRRYSRYKIMAWLALVLFNIFIPTDALLLPDIFPLTAYVRLFVFSPLLLLALLWLRHPSSARFRDGLVMLMVWLAAASILLFLCLSKHSNVAHYQMGLILVVMFGTILVRLPFWKATVCALVVVLAYIATVCVWVGGLAPDLILNASVVLFVAVIMSLVANYQMEFDARRAYAQDLLQELNGLRLSQANADLLRLSRLDGLTEIANRRAFDEAFALAWKDTQRSQKPLAVIMLDVDAFKAYNDQYGHAAGDECLQKIAHVLMGALFRSHDLAARYGGEEFVVLLPDTDDAAAFHVAERMLAGVHELQLPHAGNPAAPVVTFSAGVAAVIPLLTVSPQAVLKAADDALYAAKQVGRNRIIKAASLV